MIKSFLYRRFSHLPYFSLIKDYVVLFTSKSLQMGLAFIREIIVAKILGPTGFGTWKGIEVIQLYHQYSTLGTQNALSREIPKLRGMKKIDEINELRNVALGHIFTLPLIFSIIIGLYSFVINDKLIQFGVRMTAVNVLLLMGVNYFVRLYFADMRFTLYSKITIYMSFLTNIVAVFIALMFNAKAPYIIIMFNNTVWLFVLLIYGRYKLKPVFSLSKIMNLIKIGFPIMLVGLVYGLLTTVDRLIILNFLDITNLGYYSLLIMVGLVITGVSDSFGEIIYPRMNKRYGEVGTRESLDFLLFTPGYILATFLSMIGCVIIFVIYVVGPRLLSEYAPGFTSAMIFCVGSGIGGGSILNTIDKQWQSVLIQIISLLLNIIISLWLIKLNLGIIAVAIGTTIALIVYKLGVTVASFCYLDILWKYQFKRMCAFVFPACLTGIYFITSRYIYTNYENNDLFHIINLCMFMITFLFFLYRRIQSVFNQSVCGSYGIVR